MEFSSQRYQEALAALFRRFPSVQNVPLQDAYKPGLEHMEAFDARLGHPHRRYPVIHVAGTNGKGSVSNLLAAALSRCGLRTGLYTSPHIRDFRERMRVAGTDGAAMIPPEAAFDFIQRWGTVFEEMSLSFFEITTGMAFSWFADCEVDVAVIETGLGGRLDSTNIVQPVLSLVTNIGMDHMRQLGDSLEAIAAEKAGIFKAGVPALVGETLPQTRPVFEAAARAVCAPLYFAEDLHPALEADEAAILQEMDLQGPCQARNLHTVLAARDLLEAVFPGLARLDTVRQALVGTAAHMDFHGRWERLSRDPEILCDIGHNAAALRGNFARLAERPAGTDLILVYGIMADKDLDAILPLMPRDARFRFAAPRTARALPAETLLQRFRAFRRSAGLPACDARACPGVADAVESALEAARSSAKAGRKPLVYIGGSTFVVAEALESLFRKDPDKNHRP